MLTEKSRRSDSIALPKRQLIAAWRLSGDGLALSVIACARQGRVAAPSVCFAVACILLAAAPTAPPCFRRWRRSSPLPPKGEAFCAFLLKKLPEDTCYWTFILLYSCQNKKTQEGRGMKDIELRYVGGHVEVYTETGAFLFSADTLREAMEELDAA